MVVHFQNFTAPEAVVSTSAEARHALPKVQTGHLYRSLFKRVLDVLLVLAALPVTLPVVLVMALLVARDGASPFFLQKRVTKNGRIFHMVKIRTMVPDAEGYLASYLAKNPAARREWDETQKLKDDPRITRVGRLLRKTSLDELPQLWNVLKGDMSLVGPRPMMVDQQDLYPGRAYYALRPGITGSWQVSDRNNGTFAGRAKFDAEYYANLSLATDLSILLRTVSVVVRGTGY
jgi:lipopolysaccharide/colanic/teichoic acid biosynthesis glycosyltransferase